MKRSRTTNTQNTDTPKNDNQLPTDNTPDCTEYLAQTGERIMNMNMNMKMKQ